MRIYIHLMYIQVQCIHFYQEEIIITLMNIEIKTQNIFLF